MSPASTTQGWLMKTEPDAFSIADLQREGTTRWDGIRNYEARNYLRAMQVGDQVLIYHSNTTPPSIVGLGVISKTAYPDPLQFDLNHKYGDPKSSTSDPRWSAVDVTYQATFTTPLSRDDLRNVPEWAVHMLFTRSRLSVIPVPMPLLKATVKRADR